MKKKILFLGSGGFIGQETYNQIKNIDIFDVYRFSVQKNQFIDTQGVNIKEFDILIFAAGIHQGSEKDNDIFLSNKKIIKALYLFSKKIKSCVFISSFKTSINFSKKIVSEENKYNVFSIDSSYGKTKIINEKIALKLFKKRLIKFKIVSPTHVIGPGKDGLNNYDILKRKKKLLNILPDCFIPFIDVRDVARYIKKIIIENNFDNKKIILNTVNLHFKDYIQIIKKNNLFNFNITINKKFLKIFYTLNKFIFKFNFLTKFRFKYINSNIQTIINKEMKENISIEKSIKDVLNLYNNQYR